MFSKRSANFLFAITMLVSLTAHSQVIVNDSVIASIHRFKMNVGIKSVVLFDNRFLCLDDNGKLFFVNSKSDQIDPGINKYSTNYFFEKLEVIDNILVGTEGYRDKYKSYAFDVENRKWTRYKQKKHTYPGKLLFQDAQYFVSSTCSGEWGGTIYFTNKKSSKIYEGACTCAVNVIKEPGYYNVTASVSHMLGFASVFHISDPSKLKLSSRYLSGPPNSIDAAGATGNAESRSIKGMEKLVDTVGATCAGSFRYKNSTLYLVERRPLMSHSTFWIDSIRNKKFVPLVNLTPFGIGETGYDQFNSDDIFITPFQNEEKFSGFICIINNKLGLYIFDRSKGKI